MKGMIVTALLAGLATPGVPVTQVRTRDLPKLREALMTSLDVKEGGGDFTDWVREASIQSGALVRQFRWKTSVAGAAAAKFEVVHGAFPASPTVSQPINLKLNGYSKRPSSPGAYGTFTIDFTPVLQASVGTSRPAEPVTFHVRIILLDKQNQSLARTSAPVKITYAPPADGTNFSGSSMVVRLTTVKCIEVTDGLGDDELDVTVIARPINGSPATRIYTDKKDIDDGQAFYPSKTLWTFQGLSFEPDAQLFVVLQEDDAGNSFQAGIQPPPNGAGVDSQLYVSLLVGASCGNDHDCIGSPQMLPVTAADWYKVAVQKQTVTRMLTFKGLGAHYEATFQLAPK